MRPSASDLHAGYFPIVYRQSHKRWRTRQQPERLTPAPSCIDDKAPQRRVSFVIRFGIIILEPEPNERNFQLFSTMFKSHFALLVCASCLAVSCAKSRSINFDYEITQNHDLLVSNFVGFEGEINLATYENKHELKYAFLVRNSSATQQYTIDLRSAQLECDKVKISARCETKAGPEEKKILSPLASSKLKCAVPFDSDSAARLRMRDQKAFLLVPYQSAAVTGVIKLPVVLRSGDFE